MMGVMNLQSLKVLLLADELKLYYSEQTKMHAIKPSKKSNLS